MDEVIKLEYKMNSYFKNTKKDIILTEQDEEDFKNKNNCRFCEKNIESDEVIDHCLLTGKNRDHAHNTCCIKATQKQRNFIPFIFHSFSNYDCHPFFRKLTDKKTDKVKFKFIPRTNEE